MFKDKKNKIEMSSGADAHERRRHGRHPFTATVEAVETNTQTRINGRTGDMSRGGCYVDTISSFPPGSIVKMRLTKETDSFEAMAEVVYSMVGMGMGVKFTYAEPEQFWTLQKWVGELSGEIVTEPEALRPSNPSCVEGKPGNEENEVLNELLMLLTKQGVLSDANCEAMLAKLNRPRSAKLDSPQAEILAN
jgi:hypothetical protein